MKRIMVIGALAEASRLIAVLDNEFEITEEDKNEMGVAFHRYECPDMKPYSIERREKDWQTKRVNGYKSKIRNKRR